jgi:hypothetical protein
MTAVALVGLLLLAFIVVAAINHVAAAKGRMEFDLRIIKDERRVIK